MSRKIPPGHVLAWLELDIPEGVVISLDVAREARRKAAPGRLEVPCEAWEARRRREIGELPEGRARREAGRDLEMQIAALRAFCPGA